MANPEIQDTLADPMNRGETSVLVVGPSWVGDMIMAQGLYKAIRTKNPEAQIDVIAPQWSAGVLQRMPEVRQVIEMPVGHGQFGWAARKALGHSLRGRYEKAYVLPNSWKSALVPWFAQVPLRVGYLGEMRFGLLNQIHRLDQRRLPRLVDRYLALAGATPSQALNPSLEIDPQSQAAALGGLGLDVQRPILALCPGAEFGPAKRWPSHFYAEIARHHLAQGWQVWLFGSPNDTAVCQAILNEIGWADVASVRDLSGKTSLAQVADLLALAGLVLTNDSGLMHLAAAVGAPVVAVYGSSDPGYTPPLSNRSQVVRLGLACSPCFKKTCPLGHTDCLNKLEPKRVISAVSELLNR